jgi:hypothetical protein
MGNEKITNERAPGRMDIDCPMQAEGTTAQCYWMQSQHSTAQNQALSRFLTL